MIEELKQLQELLHKFESGSTADRNAAIDLVGRWAKRTKLLGYSAEQLYRAVSIASSQRRPQDVDLLRDISELDTTGRPELVNVVQAAKEELSPATSLFSGAAGRRQL